MTRLSRAGAAAPPAFPLGFLTRHAVIVSKGHRQAWNLNPDDVSIGGSSSSASTRGRGGMARSSRSEDTRSHVVRLLHRPTGVEVSGEIPPGTTAGTK